MEPIAFLIATSATRRSLEGATPGRRRKAPIRAQRVRTD